MGWGGALNEIFFLKCRVNYLDGVVRSKGDLSKIIFFCVELILFIAVCNVLYLSCSQRRLPGCHSAMCIQWRLHWFQFHSARCFFFNNINVSCAARSRVLNDDSSIVARPGVINGDSRGRPRLFNKTSILFRSQLMAIIAQKAMAKHKT